MTQENQENELKTNVNGISNPEITVLLVALSLLATEILLSKMYMFFLGNISSYVAIPITMLGLSLGALCRHCIPATASAASTKKLTTILAFLTPAAFGLFYFTFNTFFDLTHFRFQNPIRDAAKVVTLSSIFLPIFAIGGMILSNIFNSFPKKVGKLYGLDLAGSALACVFVPISLHHLSLVPTIFLILFLVLMSWVFFGSKKTSIRRLLIAITTLVCIGTLHFQFKIYEESFDANKFSGPWESQSAKQLTSRWSEVSRIALVQFGNETYKLLHDDGVSNVSVISANKTDSSNPLYKVALMSDQAPKSILVMFAGAGRDMINLDQLSAASAHITGVEINHLIYKTVTTPPFNKWGLKKFFTKDNINLIVTEGRSFLDSTDKKFDLIFVASNGAAVSSRIGHNRKYLDTYEAQKAYLSKLTPNGALVFHYQPFPHHKFKLFQKAFASLGNSGLADKIAIVGLGPKYSVIDSHIIKPSGFTASEIERLASIPNTHLHYAPGLGTDPSIIESIKTIDYDNYDLPTDDRPYERKIDFGSLDIIPDQSRIDELWVGLSYASDWLKVFTLVFFIVISGIISTVFFAVRPGGKSLSPSMFSYFIITGVCYMFLQITCIAKLELVVGMPLYSVACILGSFLLANGAGSYTIGKLAHFNPLKIAGICASLLIFVIPITYLAIDQLSQSLEIPLVLRITLGAAFTLPMAFIMGTFYPIGVTIVNRRFSSELIPMTFGLTTISSVVGSAMALILIVNLGFWNVAWLAVTGYLLLLLLVAAMIKSNKFQ